MRVPVTRKFWSVAALGVLALGPARADVDPGRLAGLRARLIGPAGMSGRIAALEGVAADPSVVYAGAATGGVWKSTNGGLTFKPLFDDQPVHAIGAIAVFQADPNVVWVGTGEGNTRNSASVGNGVYKSNDAGKTWKHLGLEKTERIYRIRLDPTDARVAYVCALGQEWGENPERGVFKTLDGGATWSHVLKVDSKTGCGDLAMDPKHPGRLIASMWEFRRWPHFFKSGGPGSGLFVTNDGGASWRRLQQEDGLPKGELGRIGLAISPSNPDVAYALVEAKSSALIRSEDGGRTWKSVNDKPDVAPRPFYFADIRVDPEWPDRLYSLDYNIRVSNDGGRTFETLPGATWELVHGDHHAMWIDPRDPRHIYDGNDGGIAVSHDRGRNFRFVSNLPLAQFYHVALDDERPYNVLGGLQDNSSWRGPSSVWQEGGIRNHHWQIVGGGDGFETLPDPRDSTQGYSLLQGGYLFRWNVKTGEQRIVKPAPPKDVRLRFNWNAGLALDPFEPDTVYIGSQFVHRSRDRGETWEIVSPDLTTNKPEWQKQDESGGLTTDVTAAENQTTIVAIAPSARQKGVIWVGSDDGRIHVTRDGGTTWTSVEKNVRGVPADTWIPHVEVSPFDAGTAFVVFDNHRRSDWTPYVFKTEDYGRTWKSLATPGLRGYALVVRQDPVKPELLYLGTEFGLYVSFDGGAKWTQLEKTIPTASVMDLKVHPREHDLVIATHGRAVWILDDLRPLRELTEAALLEPLRLYPIADAQQAWLKPEEAGFGFGAGEFRGESRPYGAILTWSMNVPGLPLFDEEKERERKEKERQAKAGGAATEKSDDKQADEPPKVTIEVKDAAGRLVRTFKAPARLGLNRATWDLRRDAFRQTPRAEGAPAPQQEPTGPELPPGAYSLTVKYGEHAATESVTVLADPRSANTPADWTRRWDTILETGTLRDSLVDAIWRLRHVRDDVGVVQAKARAAAEAKGEKDAQKLGDLPLVKAGDKLKEGLAKLDKRLWQSPDTPGLLPDLDALGDVDRAAYFIRSAWAPPSPTHLDHLRLAKERVAAALKEVDAFFAGDVAAYRKQVDEAGVGLLVR